MVVRLAVLRVGLDNDGAEYCRDYIVGSINTIKRVICPYVSVLDNG